MKRVPLVLSDLAIADILEQAEWYGEQSGETLVKRWERAVTATILRVIRNPDAGALCSFHNNELRHVRRAAIAGFSKHLLFYRLQGAKILILRVLHGARDLESIF